MTKFVRFMKDESGATAIEYGLIAAGIGMALILVLPQVGAALEVMFASIRDAVTP